MPLILLPVIFAAIVFGYSTSINEKPELKIVKPKTKEKDEENEA